MSSVFKLIDRMVSNAEEVTQAFPGCFDTPPADLTKEQADAVLYMQIVSWHVMMKLPPKVLRHVPALVEKGYLEQRRGLDTGGPRVRLALKGGT